MKRSCLNKGSLLTDMVKFVVLKYCLLSLLHGEQVVEGAGNENGGTS